jgi:methionyl aminopeptidase
MHGDNSAMVMLENDEVKVHPDIKRLSQVTREAMYKGIELVKPGTKFNEIGEIIDEYARAHGFYVNEEFGGHGIGPHLHMAPLVHMNKSKTARSDEMRPGMAFTIEPILMMSGNFRYV